MHTIIVPHTRPDRIHGDGIFSHVESLREAGFANGIKVDEVRFLGLPEGQSYPWSATP